VVVVADYLAEEPLLGPRAKPALDEVACLDHNG
jgi:hypothetical protein